MRSETHSAPGGGIAQHDAGTAALVAELGHVTGLLHQMLAAERAELVQLVVLNTPPTVERMDGFPQRGSSRLLMRRTGNGAVAATVDTTGELVIPGNEARVGGQIVNTGTVGVTLYLADKAGAAIPALWLAPSGGAWDFRLGSILWAGDVFAVADSTTTPLTWGEL